MGGAPNGVTTRTGQRIERLPTGLKIFAIITLALLPLGLVALFASLAAMRTADIRRDADLRIALIESSRKLGSQLASDISAMRDVVNEVERSPGEACKRAASIFARGEGRLSQFAVIEPSIRQVCGSTGFSPNRPATRDVTRKPEIALATTAIDIRVPATRGDRSLIVRYPVATLDAIARPSTLGAPYGLSLTDSKKTLSLRTIGRHAPARSASVPIGVLGLTLTVSSANVSLGPTGALLTFLPLLMWASAALIGFFVVDRLLIRPLRQLREAVATHVPGTPFELPPVRTPAREILDLGETFSRHDARLATALADQMRATREVHHRVKNNLQVIASLISLHARGGHAPDATTAYAAIQRRVDALSIVHRNHYAELDSETGIDIKRLLAELATNLRATASVDKAAASITISAAHFGVSQDSAVAIAFLLTELVEMSMLINAAAPISITVTDASAGTKARLALTSNALKGDGTESESVAPRYARIIEGLSRQLRAPIHHDRAVGSYTIDFAVLGPPSPPAN